MIIDIILDVMIFGKKKPRDWGGAEGLDFVFGEDGDDVIDANLMDVAIFEDELEGTVEPVALFGGTVDLVFDVFKGVGGVLVGGFEDSVLHVMLLC